MRIRKDKSGLDAKLVPTDLDVAWAAGIYEGEGSCVAGGNGGRSFAVRVNQKDPEMLYRMKDLFGGSIKLYDEEKKGRVNGRFSLYAWTVCGDRARTFLGSIYPYLTSRRKAQIDATSAGRFLQIVGVVPQPVSSPSVSLIFMQGIISDHVSRQRKLADEKNKQRHKDFYESRKASDPGFMEKRRQQTRRWRETKKASGEMGQVIAIA